jgi:hypothetical protein
MMLRVGDSLFNELCFGLLSTGTRHLPAIQKKALVHLGCETFANKGFLKCAGD